VSNPRQRLCGLLVVGSGLALAAVAHAGLRTPGRVAINASARNAQGSTGGARNSPNNTLESIDCRTISQPPYSEIQCYATTAAGASAYCFVDDSSGDGNNLGALPLISDGAFLAFSWNPSGQCTSITVAVSSSYEPKKP